MHPNSEVLQRLFSGLNRHDHEAMAACYQKNATFRDIAFWLKGKNQIHAMWHLICAPPEHPADIKAMFQIIHADEHSGWVNLVDEYTFGPNRNKVINVIDSHFGFRDGLIESQNDFCDSRSWAAMAIGGLSGFLAGEFRFLRSRNAAALLREFVRKHPQCCEN
jgi:SnoaL-like domain